MTINNYICYHLTLPPEGLQAPWVLHLNWVSQAPHPIHLRRPMLTSWRFGKTHYRCPFQIDEGYHLGTVGANGNVSGSLLGVIG
jgi:hypothetical protein